MPTGDESSRVVKQDGPQFRDWGFVNTDGIVGGILLLWDKRTLEMVKMELGVFSISCMFRKVKDGFQWTVTGFYGPVVGTLRECFWEELGAIRGLWTRPWCIGGDFNAITSPCESNKGGMVSSIMRRFVEVIDDLGLRDLPLQGGPFT